MWSPGYHRYGGSEELQLEEVALLVPKGDEKNRKSGQNIHFLLNSIPIAVEGLD